MTESVMFRKGEGLFDFVLMDTVSEDAFMANLETRFKKGLIYTNIGEAIVSVNPFAKMPEVAIDSYVRQYMYEVPPHIYALADDTYRAMMMEKENQCVIITGESGAGKTEASKVFMRYIAHISRSSADSERIKDRLLESNPVLEAFGNAKTLRNDNSSRFGKYMELQFDLAGAPVGGRISQYLLEKSRVITRAAGERSYHIFYQMLAMPAMCAALGLSGRAADYQYLALSSCYELPGVSDAAEYEAVRRAVTTLGWAPAELTAVFEVLAAILHLGNLELELDEDATRRAKTDIVRIANEPLVAQICALLRTDVASLLNALTSRSISTGVGRRASQISVQLDLRAANFTRDALAKTLYARLFDWVVAKINGELQPAAGRFSEVVIGILDIYGFEIFESNSFEQFCINYCNEKLQQYFIANVLQSEQAEYVREGIAWTEIDFFNNQDIISLIEGQGRVGILLMLDEACLVGNSTPITLVEKLTTALGAFPRFATGESSRDRTLKPENFRIAHYAGDVVYDTSAFLDKNRDTVFADLVAAMQTTSNPLVAALFPDNLVANSKKRPETAGAQFKKAVCSLIDTLQACHPHYIRCIKSNDLKRGGTFDTERIRHQVVYLNLVENVRVRKAGFASRQHYARFMWRYKMLSPVTWPIWRGNDRDGVRAILDAVGVPAGAYELGKSKVFIKDAATFVLVEQRRQEAMPKVAVQIQKVWKGYKTRIWFVQYRAQMEEERRQREEERRRREEELRRKKATNTIGLAFHHWVVRRDAGKMIAAFGNAKADRNFGKYTQWPQTSHWFAPMMDLSRRLWLPWWGRSKVGTLSEQEQVLMRQKIAAMDIFRGNKPWACARAFTADYLNTPTYALQAQYKAAIAELFSAGGDSRILFADEVTKINPKLKLQRRVYVVTEANMYKYDPVKLVIKKEAIPIAKIAGVYVSRGKDTMVCVRMAAPLRDLVLDLGLAGVERVSELVTVLVDAFHQLTGGVLAVHFSETITFNNSRDADPKNPAVTKKPGSDEQMVFAPDNGVPKWPEGAISFFVKGKDHHTVYFRAWA